MSQPNAASVIRQQEQQEKLSLIYDRDILQLWSVPFGRMLLRGLTVPPRATVLDVACGTGYPTLDLLPYLDAKSRIIALDFSHEMLNVARHKAGELSGKRIFFKHGRIEDLNFAAETFDLVVCNCGLLDFNDRGQGVREMARAAKRGAEVRATLPLRGTFREFYDLYREVLQRFELHDSARRLDDYIAQTPTAEEAAALFWQAGLENVQIDRREVRLLFPSGREFFFHPLIEYCYLQSWKDLIPKPDMLQAVFWHIKNAIDRYFARRAFVVTVDAALLVGVKP